MKFYYHVKWNMMVNWSLTDKAKSMPTLLYHNINNLLPEHFKTTSFIRCKFKMTFTNNTHS